VDAKPNTSKIVGTGGVISVWWRIKTKRDCIGNSAYSCIGVG
jgi:hypothetical protein